ncbi:hypothetical protein [Streptomyces sp. HP-A2021]|uniref:hypothetical protein n=1 Tax=Streptomyces sp. HP-A2021 TaxID=2927875 RepID=UPI00243592F3|nr:hypothetical protein [Streptomyces sp. HP-A2021]
MLDAKFVVAALILNMFSAFIVLHTLINPYKVGEEPEIAVWVLCMKIRASLKCWANTFWQASKWPLSLPAMLIGFDCTDCRGATQFFSTPFLASA